MKLTIEIPTKTLEAMGLDASDKASVESKIHDYLADMMFRTARRKAAHDRVQQLRTEGASDTVKVTAAKKSAARE